MPTGRPMAPSVNNQSIVGAAPSRRVTTDDENPLPTLHAVCSMEGSSYGSHHYASEHTAHLADGCKERGSLRDFQWFAVEISVLVAPRDCLNDTYYQDPMTYIVPLHRLASKKPCKNLTAASCSKFLQAAQHIVSADQMTSVVGSQIRG